MPIGVLPVGAQDSGSLNRFVRRAALVAGSRKWPTAVRPLGGRGRVVHADGFVQIVQQVVVGPAGQDLEQAPGHDHSAVRVADVLLRPEENTAVPAQRLEIVLQRTGTVGVDEQQVRIDPVRVTEQMAHPDPFCRSVIRQPEFR